MVAFYHLASWGREGRVTIFLDHWPRGVRASSLYFIFFRAFILITYPNTLRCFIFPSSETVHSSISPCPKWTSDEPIKLPHTFQTRKRKTSTSLTANSTFSTFMAALWSIGLYHLPNNLLFSCTVYPDGSPSKSRFHSAGRKTSRAWTQPIDSSWAVDSSRPFKSETGIRDGTKWCVSSKACSNNFIVVLWSPSHSFALISPVCLSFFDSFPSFLFCNCIWISENCIIPRQLLEFFSTRQIPRILSLH